MLRTVCTEHGTMRLFVLGMEQAKKFKFYANFNSILKDFDGCILSGSCRKQFGSEMNV